MISELESHNLKESSILEFKKSTAELKQALEDICAFANTGEGSVYFGLTDSGELVGQDVSDNTIKRVSTTILSTIEPRIYPNAYEDTIDNKMINLIFLYMVIPLLILTYIGKPLNIIVT